jgi:hypothetical protein
MAYQAVLESKWCSSFCYVRVRQSQLALVQSLHVVVGTYAARSQRSSLVLVDKIHSKTFVTEQIVVGALWEHADSIAVWCQGEGSLGQFAVRQESAQAAEPFREG